MTQKILFAIELNYTLFNPRLDKAANLTWIGSAQFWTSLFNQLINMASARNVDVMFMIIPSTDIFDDICQEAVKHLYPLFNTAQIEMLTHNGFCLVKHIDSKQNAFYHSANNSDKFPAKQHFSHFVLAGNYYKSDAIIALAAQYSIPPSQCILLDASDDIALPASKAGINAVATTCFYNEEHLDEDYINDCLPDITKALSGLFERAIQRATCNNQIDDYSSSMIKQFSDLIENKENNNLNNNNNAKPDYNNKQPLTFRPSIRKGRYSPDGISKKADRPLNIKITQRGKRF